MKFPLGLNLWISNWNQSSASPCLLLVVNQNRLGLFCQATMLIQLKITLISSYAFQESKKRFEGSVRDHFVTRLDRIDNLLVRGEFKLKVYTNYLLPSCRFLLTVHDITKTHLLALDSTVHRYLKKWIGLPRSASPGFFHIPLLTDVKSVYQIYLEAHSSAYLSSRLKGDGKVNNALDSRLARETEWSKKFSITCYADTKFIACKTSTVKLSYKMKKRQGYEVN